jgi:hypothetical protein
VHRQTPQSDTILSVHHSAYQPPTPPTSVPLIQFHPQDTIHRIFTVFSPDVVFTSDSGATDILIRSCDAHILTQYTIYTDSTSPPGFDVANYNQIFPIAHGKLSIPNTNITLDAFVFQDDDLHSNLFGIAPLTQHGLSATYTDTDLQISAPTAHGPKIIIYGVKNAIQTCGVSPSPRSGNQQPPTSSVTNNTLNSFSMLPPLLDPLQPKRSTKPLLKGGLPITLPSPQR